jgi:hypothetical protein
MLKLMSAKHPGGEGRNRVTLSIGSSGDTKKSEIKMELFMHS